jgi:Tfp pilus assembly protein PilF
MVTEMVLRKFKFWFGKFSLMLILVVFGGCSLLDTRFETEPDYDLGKPQRLRNLPSIFTSANRPPATNPAVQTLIATAHEQVHSGQSDLGLATLERALAIDPNNARIWSEMARIHLTHGDPRQAIELARRSLDLATSTVEMQKENWVLIHRAAQKMGDQALSTQAMQALTDLNRVKPSFY